MPFKSIQLEETQAHLSHLLTYTLSQDVSTPSVLFYRRAFDDKISLATPTLSNLQEEYQPIRQTSSQATKTTSLKCNTCSKVNCRCKSQSCLYCMQAHSTSQCVSSLICYRCNQPGHLAKNCQGSTMQCHKCKSRGHRQRQCGKLIGDDVTRQWFESECIRCGGSGHWRCTGEKQQHTFVRQEERQDVSVVNSLTAWRKRY